MLDRAPNICMCSGSDTREALEAGDAGPRRKFSVVSIRERPETTWSRRTLEITTTCNLEELRREGKFAAQMSDDPESN